MDFATKTFDDYATLQLRDPITDEVLTDNDGNPVTITLYGRDSSVYRQAENREANKRLSKRKFKATKEQLDASGLEILAACTKDWSGIEWEGELMSCSQDNARKLYKAAPWVREQVDEFVDDRANFTTNA